MQTPLVSIIIPTYNRAHLLGETLDSVLEQTYTNWECIVVDDGSTDETDKLLATYCANDNRFQYHHRPSDRPKGANACRNYGFELSKGEYVNWFDSDDIMAAERIEKKVVILESSPQIDYCVSSTQNFEEEFKVENFKKISKNILTNNLYEDYILGKFSILLISPIWRKKLLDKYNLFDEELQQSQDLDLYSRIIFENQNIFFLPEILIYVRRNNNSITTFNKIIDIHTDSFLEVKDRIINRTPNNEKIKEFNLKMVLWLFRYNLSNKKYVESKKCLNFATNKIKKQSVLLKLNLMKVTFFYHIFKILGRGDTMFKFLLKL